MRLCLDPARLKKALIRPMDRGPKLDAIILRLAGMKHLTLAVASSGYHYLKLDENPSHLKTFSCLFGRYRNIRPPFRAAPAGYMFQGKIVELYSGMSNIFDIAEDILVAGFGKS